MGILGELKVISGRVHHPHFKAGSLTLYLGDRGISMPLSASHQEFVNEGSEVEFVVRRNVLFRHRFVARAFRLTSEGKTYTGRTAQHWAGVIVGLAGAATWASSCVRHTHCSSLTMTQENFAAWLIPFWFAYAVLAIIETHRAKKLLSTPRR